MKNRVTELFKKKNKGLLSVFYTAGFPAMESTVAVAKYLDDAGADIIEIGIPFSDPVADGPVIQQSNKTALSNGISLKLILEQVREIRMTQKEIPIILMGYLNPVMQFGIAEFARAASEAGVDGVIIPDLPIEEFEEQYKKIFDSANLCNTFLISPTTSEHRIRKIDAVTEGFIYAVSASSTTGVKDNFSDDQLVYFDRLKRMKLDNPFLIGFGISGKETFLKASEYSNGVIVGSAFVNMIRESEHMEGDIKQFIKSLKG